MVMTVVSRITVPSISVTSTNINGSYAVREKIPKIRGACAARPPYFRVPPLQLRNFNQNWRLVMMNECQPVEALIDEIKGTTGVLSGLLARISGLVIFFVVLGVIASEIIFK
jgi:hypothetical protein